MVMADRKKKQTKQQGELDVSGLFKSPVGLIIMDFPMHVNVCLEHLQSFLQISHICLIHTMSADCLQQQSAVASARLKLKTL